MLAKNDPRKRAGVRALGIDFGERRIGLALSDPEGRWAMPWRTLERETDRRAAHRIADLARREGVAVLVLGEPRGLDGSVGPAVARIRRFGERLARASGLPVRRVDEALTTVEATERLERLGLDHRDHPERRDAVAAQVLLQEALDRGFARDPVADRDVASETAGTVAE